MSNQSRNSEELRPPLQVEAGVAVVADEPRELYKDGMLIVVSSRDVPRLMQQGWLSANPEQIPSIVERIKLLATEVGRNAEEFSADVETHGHINADDNGVAAAAMVAISMLNNAWNELVTLIAAAYPYKQAETVSYTHHNPRTGDDEVHELDPTQYPLIDAEGMFRAVDPADAERLQTLGWHSEGVEPAPEHPDVYLARKQ